MSAPERVQFQLRIPYKFQPTRHHEVRERLESGWKVEDLQRLSDQEVVITLIRPASA